jgi:putative membrane protein
MNVPARQGKSWSEPLALLALVTAALAISAIKPHDYVTWWLEVMPVFIAAPLLVATSHRFRFTSLAYWLIALHALILIVGGHYTYAEVPIGNWLRDTFDLGRNHYDRLGHFAQGFVPAIIAREILLRRTPLPRGKWLSFLVSSVCLSISACYEFIEWWSAVLGGSAADAFLGSQGDVWDTQWDMLMALIGSIVAQLSLSTLHDRQLVAVLASEPGSQRK